MATFAYIARRPDGAEARGNINAVSEDAAREELRKRGLMLEDIREVTPPAQPQQQKPSQPKPQQQPDSAFQASPGKQAKQQQRAKSVQQPTLPRPVQQKPTAPTVSAQPKPNKPAPLPWSATTNTSAQKKSELEYAPLHETLRIFAGWLLAWYGFIYALGFLEYSESIPPVPFIHELFRSPLVLQFTFGTFLFLALSNIHRWIGKGLLAGFFLAIVWCGALAGFVIYG